MKTCIVNYITRNTWHPHGQERLKESIHRTGYDGDILVFDNENFTTCPPHSKTPYGFKLFVMDEARKLGYDKVLWLDASFWAIRTLDGLFEMIEENGFLVQDSGYPLGQWVTDDCVKRMGENRNELFDHRIFSGGFMGIDFSNKEMNSFFNRFFEYAKEGHCFRGPWRNKDNEASTDPRVSGHRHDMSVGSILMKELGMSIHLNNTFFDYYAWHQKYKTEKDLSKIYFVCEGGPRKLPLKGLDL